MAQNSGISAPPLEEPLVTIMTPISSSLVTEGGREIINFSFTTVEVPVRHEAEVLARTAARTFLPLPPDVPGQAFLPVRRMEHRRLPRPVVDALEVIGAASPLLLGDTLAVVLALDEANVLDDQFIVEPNEEGGVDFQWLHDGLFFDLTRPAGSEDAECWLHVVGSEAGRYKAASMADALQMIVAALRAREITDDPFNPYKKELRTAENTASLETLLKYFYPRNSGVSAQY